VARRHSSRFIRPAPRTKMWIGTGVGNTALAGSTKTFVALLSAGGLLLRPFTILRVRMELFITSDQNTTTETLIGTYGKIVVTDTAASIGVTAIPDPSVIAGDPEADWFISQSFSHKFFRTATGVDAAAGTHYVIDSKAMRKVGPDDQVVSMATLDTAPGANLITHGRMLIQLH